jgi:hypothetical protein
VQQTTNAMAKNYNAREVSICLKKLASMEVMEFSFYYNIFAQGHCSNALKHQLLAIDFI